MPVTIELRALLVEVQLFACVRNRAFYFFAYTKTLLLTHAGAKLQQLTVLACSIFVTL